MSSTARRCSPAGRRRRVSLVAIPLLSVSALAGCLIDDSGAGPGPGPRAPTASVPDAGGPTRRESAAKTLNDADPDRPPAEGTLDVPPPPAQ